MQIKGSYSIYGKEAWNFEINRLRYFFVCHCCGIWRWKSTASDIKAERRWSSLPVNAVILVLGKKCCIVRKADDETFDRAIHFYFVDY